jgi:hypothetical protein
LHANSNLNDSIGAQGPIKSQKINQQISGMIIEKKLKLRINTTKQDGNRDHPQVLLHNHAGPVTQSFLLSFPFQQNEIYKTKTHLSILNRGRVFFPVLFPIVCTPI